MAGAALGLTTGYAQQQDRTSVVFSNQAKNLQTAEQPVVSTNVRDLKRAAQHSAGTGAKTTATNRFYNHADALVQTGINGGLEDNANISLIPIWFDSTIRQRFSTGLGTVNYSSINQYFDLIRSTLFNDPTTYLGEQKVGVTDAYKIDSVTVFAAYIRQSSKAAIVDTLIMSVAADNGAYRFTTTSLPEVAPYLASSGKDTLFAYTVLNVDSINRAAFSGVTGGSRALWKIPLTAADGDTEAADGSVMLRRYAFAVPAGGFTVPAGNGFNVTVTFKSGDTWVKNVDTINGMNTFRPVSYGTAAIMPYYYWDFNRDRNMSGQMFSTDTTTYLPTVIIEALNTIQFRSEFHDIGVVTSCATCATVTTSIAVDGIQAFQLGQSYPNPANTELHVPFTSKQSGVVTAQLTNVTGQVVDRLTVGQVALGQNARATFNTSTLAEGLYLVTLEVNGVRTTGRVVVAH